MAKIIENPLGRRMIIVSTDDIINIVREYQLITLKKYCYSDIRKALSQRTLFIPEDI